MAEVLTLVDPLAEWRLTLHNGSAITVWAHMFEEKQGSYVFSALTEGRPAEILILCSIPMSLVVDVVGGGYTIDDILDSEL